MKNKEKIVLTSEIKRKFLNLSCALSPENISCDGELPARQVNARRKALVREWKALEREAGCAVNEDDVWLW